MPSFEQQDLPLAPSEPASDENLTVLARRLRRAKRRLLLQAAENGGNETERLREMLLRLPINSRSASGGFSTGGNSVETYN